MLQVNRWLEDLLWENRSSMDIYRCKGVLDVHNSDQIHTIQVIFCVVQITIFLHRNFVVVIILLACESTVGFRHRDVLMFMFRLDWVFLNRVIDDIAFSF